MTGLLLWGCMAGSKLTSVFSPIKCKDALSWDGGQKMIDGRSPLWSKKEIAFETVLLLSEFL